MYYLAFNILSIHDIYACCDAATAIECFYPISVCMYVNMFYIPCQSDNSGGIRARLTIAKAGRSLFLCALLRCGQTKFLVLQNDSRDPRCTKIIYEIDTQTYIQYDECIVFSLLYIHIFVYLKYCL